jgi:glucose/arabinose dehydrogenase
MRQVNRARVSVFLVLVLTSSMVIPSISAASEADYGLDFVAMKLGADSHEVTGFEFLPDSDEFLTVNQYGEVSHYEIVRDRSITRLGGFELSGLVFGRQCAVSIVFDVDYDDNGLIYFSYCPSLHEMGIYRYHFDGQDYDSVAASKAEIFLTGDIRAVRPWHSIGTLNMDAEGNLWAPIGDKHIDDNAQNLSNPLGSVIRIVPNRDSGGSGHEPSAGNPFIGVPDHDPDIYASGVRSPWTAAFDSRGRLWVGDVGWHSFEEINLITEPGMNFGWSDVEGPCTVNCSGFSEPLLTYAHGLGGSSIWVGREYLPTGPDRYDGHLDGKMPYGDFYGDFIHMVEIDENDEIISDELVGELPRITSWGQGADGYLYVTVFDDEPTVLYRVVLAGLIPLNLLIAIIAGVVLSSMIAVQVWNRSSSDEEE